MGKFGCIIGWGGFGLVGCGGYVVVRRLDRGLGGSDFVVFFVIRRLRFLGSFFFCFRFDVFFEVGRFELGVMFFSFFY